VSARSTLWRRVVDKSGRVLLFLGALFFGSELSHAPAVPLTPYARFLDTLTTQVGYPDFVILLSLFGLILLPIARLGLPAPRPRWITATTVEVLVLAFLIGVIVRAVDTWLN
jgi:hypothetical protein